MALDFSRNSILAKFSENKVLLSAVKPKPLYGYRVQKNNARENMMVPSAGNRADRWDKGLCDIFTWSHAKGVARCAVPGEYITYPQGICIIRFASLRKAERRGKITKHSIHGLFIEYNLVVISERMKRMTVCSKGKGKHI